MSLFLGRIEELARLHRLKHLQRSCLVVIKGRRRVGKSTLVHQFARHKRLISLTGTAPTPGLTAQMQRDIFAEQLCLQLRLPSVTFQSWTKAFHFLETLLTDEDTVILFDEISWMGDLDPIFLGSLKTWWDKLIFSRNNLTLVLCGSISPWIEENILSSTAFVGRITLTLHVRPLSIHDSAQFLRKKGFAGSSYELLQLLAIAGGIPWYLELIDPKLSAERNIQNLCLEPDGQLVDEFQTIFHDLFDKRSRAYRAILELLVEGMKTQEQIQKALGLKKGGVLSKYLKHLIAAGFVSEHYQWELQKLKVGKQRLYRLCDCFSRFHLKYLAPQREFIEHKRKLPGWESIMGYQLETLLLGNRDFLLEVLDIDPEAVVRNNPYLQKATKRRKGCQVDYLIQTDTNSLILCEFKFMKKELDASILKELEQKRRALVVPRGFGKAMALFHVGGVDAQVAESPLLYRVIDLRDVLEERAE